MNTVTWDEIAKYLDTQIGKDLIGIVSNLEKKFGLSEGQANDYVLFFMGFK